MFTKEELHEIMGYLEYALADLECDPEHEQGFELLHKIAQMAQA